MRKSTIWLLTVVMAFAFSGLLYLQVNYVKIILKTNKNQFDATVKRSLEQVSNALERDEVRRYLDQDIEMTGSSFMYKEVPSTQALSKIITEISYEQHFQNSQEVIKKQEIRHFINKNKIIEEPQSPKDLIIKAQEKNQEELRKRYQYQAGLIEDVIYSLINPAHLKPIEKRINLKTLNSHIKTELTNNGLDLPYIFMVINKDGTTVYQNEALERKPKATDWTTQVLFPGDPPSKRNFLKIYFPTKSNYISSSVSFLAPSIIFSFILLLTFTFTIYIIFRQKKLSEMKSDFVNNMTHELKTPVSTISLASQMLKDTDITKNTEVFNHISTVIYDEAKRLGFLVEKVLQMSLFEKQKALLKLKEIDANDLIASTVSTFALKVEKYGGTIEVDLQAEHSTLYADEMHLTNVLFNLLDNAVKYRKKETPLELVARTRNENEKLIISIEDNGVGIKKEHRKKIFDRFYRVPTGNVHDVKGFGLGLAYVRKIIEDHNGSIKTDQEENSLGTKFIITLPFIKN